MVNLSNHSPVDLYSLCVHVNMSEFAKTLIIALLLIASVVVVFGGDFGGGAAPAGGGPGFRFVPAGTEIGRFEREGAQGFFVGTRTVEDFSKVRFEVPFTVSFLREVTRHASFDDLWISNGVMRSSDKRVTFEVETKDLKGGTIRGRVEDTNRYGALLVKFNGRCVLCKTMKAGERFEADVGPEAFTNETNELLLEASSSTWRVWAPTVYIVDLTLETGKEGEIAKTLEFVIPKDRFPVTQGRVVFRASRRGEGNLSIRVNDEEVFRGVPESDSLTVVDFRGELIKQSTNTLTFRPIGNAEYDVNALELIYFFSRGPQANATQTFALTKKDVDELPGTLEFRINRVFGKPTGLMLDIVRPDKTVTRVVPQGVLQEGTVISVTLTKASVAEGENRVVFLVSGIGGYEITDLRVRP